MGVVERLFLGALFGVGLFFGFILILAFIMAWMNNPFGMTVFVVIVVVFGGGGFGLTYLLEKWGCKF